MILVDTSVWVDHLRRSEAHLVELLNSAQVMTHPFVIGELACGNLKRRSRVLKLLQNLPQSSVASDEEALFFLENHTLMGRGIGYIDVHLLAAALLDGNTRLWTRDSRLQLIAQGLGHAHDSR